MSAILMISSDVYYYEKVSNNDIDGYKERVKVGYLDNIDTIIAMPTLDDISKNFSKKNVAFLHYKIPDSTLLEILVVKHLPMIHDFLTSQEKLYDVSEHESLRQKLQLEVIPTTNTFEQLAGAVNMKKFFRQVVRAYDNGNVEKITVFLLGIPGAGKTFLAECIAGEFGYLLVKLDLSLIMSMEDPFFKLHYFFRYVEKLAKDGVYLIILLDEIAQMLTGTDTIQTQFKGQLLTILEDLNSQRGYFVGKSMFIATENNIRIIMETTPQFMARWIESFFIHFPNVVEAKDMFKMYLKKFNVFLDDDKKSNSDEKIDKLYTLIDTYYGEYRIEQNLEDERCIYSPREIKKYCSKLSIYSEGIDRIDNKMMREVCKITPPQQVQLKIGISQMMNDAGNGFVLGN